MPKLSKEQKISRRKQIMQDALICAARKGFHQTSMRDICREAKMSIGAVYNYYKSKEEILAAIPKKDGRPRERYWKGSKSVRMPEKAFKSCLDISSSSTRMVPSEPMDRLIWRLIVKRREMKKFARSCGKNTRPWRIPL